MSKSIPARLGAECPICRHKFPTGTTGWYSHIGALRNHPNWHPEAADQAGRAALFAEEFPEFFSEAWTPSRRTPPSGEHRRGTSDRPTVPNPAPLRYCASTPVACAPRADRQR